MSKIQLTLTPQETGVLGLRADQLGYNITKYVRLLIGREALSLIEDEPTIFLSQRAVEKIDKARQDHMNGKTIELKNVDDLDSL